MSSTGKTSSSRSLPGDTPEPPGILWAPPADVRAQCRLGHYLGWLEEHRGLRFDPELFYAGAMFHDMGLTPRHSSSNERFEVDGANAARDFLYGHGISEAEIDTGNQSNCQAG